MKKGPHTTPRVAQFVAVKTRPKWRAEAKDGKVFVRGRSPFTKIPRQASNAGTVPLNAHKLAASSGVRSLPRFLAQTRKRVGRRSENRPLKAGNKKRLSSRTKTKICALTNS